MLIFKETSGKLACIFFGVCMLTLFSARAEGRPPVKPNIVLIMTDQHTASAMSCAGNTDLNTPNMDWLAANGVRFERTYVAQPLCTPSRVSMLTGRMPHETGMTVNAKPGEFLSPEWEIIGQSMQRAGYKTGYVGKWHVPINIHDKEKHGFEFIENTDRGDWKDASLPALSARFFKENKDKPFFFVTSFENPHDICEWARGDDYRTDLLPEPPAPEFCPQLPANFEIPAKEPDIIRAQQTDFKTYPTVNWHGDQWRQYRWVYNRLVEKVDAHIGLVIESLRRNDLLDNTIIIFTSEHGDGYGAHRWNQKQVLYEESINVPLIISFPGARQGTVVPELVNIGIDLYPTIGDLSGAQVPRDLPGKSLKGFLFNEGHALNRDFIVVETEFALNDKSMGIKGRALLNKRYKYVVYDKGNLREQLFDLKTDPGEMKNLYDLPEYQSVLTQMRGQLSTWVKDTKDDFSAR